MRARATPLLLPWIPPLWHRREEAVPLLKLCRSLRFRPVHASASTPPPPEVGPVQGRSPSGLRFLRRFRLARTVEGDRLANERLEGGLVNFFSFVDVDRAAC